MQPRNWNGFLPASTEWHCQLDAEPPPNDRSGRAAAYIAEPTAESHPIDPVAVRRAGTDPEHAALLIVLEGIDGSGKTTLCRLLAEDLARRGLDVVATREPWESAAARRLAGLFASTERHASAEEELALFMEDRKEHVRAVVAPALARGAWVVQDRTFYSTAAYQGARGLDPAAILEQGRRIAPEPDHVVFLRLDPERALERIETSRERATSFEKLETLRAVDRVYREMFAECPHGIELDAESPPEPC